MKLTLTLTRGDDPQGMPIDSRSFESCGLTLGRGSENDWVLDDPNRHLSKSHCAIEFDGGEFLVTDTSTNGVFINQSPERLGRGNTIGLRDGDQIGLGEYLVQVEIGAAGAAAAEAIDDDFGDLGGFDTPPSSNGVGGGTDDPFADNADLPGHAQSPDDDPFAEFDLDGPIGSGPAGGGIDSLDAFDTPDPGAASLDAFDQPSGGGAASGGLIPDDFDILGGEAPESGFEEEPEPDHVPSEGEFFRPPAARQDDSLGGGAIPDDWDSDLEEALPQETIAPVARQAPRPARAREEPPPRPTPVAATPTPVPSPAQAQPAAVSGVGSADALAAFLAGAGVDPGALGGADPEATMRIVGEAFREMVKGLQETLAARTEIKSEFRLERTMIRPKENNPLKFSPSVDEALTSLLHKTSGNAYLPPVSAVREGFDDLKAHQMAVMAGMQVALSALLRRFDPATLEKRLKSQSVLDSILPAARKAKYWELYEELYKEIAREAEDDFQGLFGKEFATAYERQVKKL